MTKAEQLKTFSNKLNSQRQSPIKLRNPTDWEPAIQNIDRICFEEKGILKEEFNKLYSSLFDNYESHIKVVKILAKKRKGLTRKEITLPSQVVVD